MRGSLSGGLPTLGDCNRIRELDGLRGVAIAMVVMFHFFQSTMAFPPGRYLLTAGGVTALLDRRRLVLRAVWIPDWRDIARFPGFDELLLRFL